MEGLESNENKRNIEKDKADFEIAIQESVNEIDTDFDAEAVASLTSDIESGNTFTLGEIHGVRENPDIIYTLIKKFGFKALGLEWKKELEEIVKNFQDNGVLDIESILESSDGRITAGHFSLLRKIKEENLVENIFLFDKSRRGKRDEGMAEEIIEQTSSGTPTIVIAGNAHTNLNEIEEVDGSKHISMVKVLQDKGTSFSVGEIDYVSGNYFNIGLKNFRQVDEASAGNPRFYKNEDGIYVYQLPTATPAVVPNPSAIFNE